MSGIQIYKSEPEGYYAYGVKGRDQPLKNLMNSEPEYVKWLFFQKVVQSDPEIVEYMTENGFIPNELYNCNNPSFVKSDCVYFTFGIYENENIDTIYKNDRRYCESIIKNNMFKEYYKKEYDCIIKIIDQESFARF